jgi:pyruvate carboxylase
VPLMQVSVPFDVCQGIVPEDVYKQACVSTTEEALALCQVVGYPAMIKASWGGGGKGIRKVHNDEEVKGIVQVRVTSEDPDDGFKPTSGQVEVTFSSPRRNPIRLD